MRIKRRYSRSNGETTEIVTEKFCPNKSKCTNAQNGVITEEVRRI